MPEPPIYPSATLEGSGPADWALVIENWLGYTMRDLVIQWGSEGGPSARDTKEELQDGELWRLPLTDHERVFTHHFEQRKAYDRDIPYELTWIDHYGEGQSYKNKAYLMDGLGESPLAPTRSDSDLNPLSKMIAFVVASAGSVWLIWCTFVAFTGGTLPLVGWEIGGGFFFGLLWLFVIDPIAMTVAYWVGMLIAMPLLLISEGVGRRAR